MSRLCNETECGKGKCKDFAWFVAQSALDVYCRTVCVCVCVRVQISIKMMKKFGAVGVDDGIIITIVAHTWLGPSLRFFCFCLKKKWTDSYDVLASQSTFFVMQQLKKKKRALHHTWYQLFNFRPSKK